MTLKALLAVSKQYLYDHPGYAEDGIGLNVFSSGAVWMQAQLFQLDGKPAQPLHNANRFTKHGILKYGISLLAFFISAFLFGKYYVCLLPLSVLIFYLVEVQFLFLFPLLIDEVPDPILKSFHATYMIGVFRALVITMGIGIFMMVGLLRVRDPLYNWHIGCLAVLIWYRDEVRDRV